MTILSVKVEPRAIDVALTGDSIRVILADGREVTVPLEWFPRLRKATPAQRKKWRLVGKGIGIHWEEIDEDISIESLLTTDNNSFLPKTA